MSEKFTQLDIDRINARRSKPGTGGEPVGDGVEDESELHAEILQECRRRGWLAVHARMDRRSTVQNGTPDFLIITDKERPLLVECKNREGKLTVAQNAWHAHARKLGFEVHVIRSFAEFMALL